MCFMINLKCNVCRLASKRFDDFYKDIQNEDTRFNKIGIYLKTKGVEDMWHDEHSWCLYHNGNRDNDWLDYDEYMKQHKLKCIK